jgi:hypothetical protein
MIPQRILHPEEKDKCIHENMIKINLTRQIDKQMKSKIELSTEIQQIARIATYLSILTLSVNGLNSTIKRHRIASWIKKQDLTICCL